MAGKSNTEWYEKTLNPLTEAGLIPELLERPFHWKTPARIFVNSMSDLFHEKIPVEFIQSVFEMMNKADWHQFQILTKRAERLAELSPELPWAENIWMGVSVEDADNLDRIYYLKGTDAHIKWISAEPLLGDLGRLNLDLIDWVVVGGESGPNARPMDKMWVYELRDRCGMTQTPFFFKQWSGRNPKKLGRLIDGREYSEYPV